MENIKLLLVEDDEDDYLLTRDLLKEIYSDNLELEWVKDYDEAMTRLVSNEHDVCLLDYRLGANNGIELLRQARERGSNCPSILLTGQADFEIDFEAMRAGASDYLIKGELNPALLERSIRYSRERRRLEDERLQLVREQQAREAAEAANRAKDDFLAMVSHELRSPLNAILGWTRILRSSNVDEETVERALETIERSAKSQAQMIEDLLDVSRVINGNLRLNLIEVDLSNIIKRLLEATYPAAEAKQIQIHTKYDEGVGVVMGDPDRLQQIFANLLSNAVKFTPESGSIEIRVKQAESQVQVSIKDTGVGISADFLPQVFERYKQGRNEHKRKHKGLGLGLAIARHLIEMHNGRIAVHSDGEGFGSTFTVFLPVTESAIHKKEGAG
jgi:signal transduction histidine kinase